MYKWLLIPIVMILAVGCAQRAGPTSTPAPTAVPPTPLAPQSNGRLVPRQFVEVGMNTSGLVAQVLVAEGDQVKADQPLVKLDDTLLKLAVQEAQLRVKQAELDLEKARKPADPADLIAAEKAVKATQAALTNAQAGVSTTVEQAQSTLRTARLAFENAERDYNHQLDRKRWGFDVEKDLSLQTSQVRYENARAEYEIAQRDVDGVTTRAAQSVVEARKALAQAEAEYALLKKRPEPEAVSAAQLAVESAQLSLAQAEADLENATLVAPLSGVVAEVKAKVGQAATPGATLVTLGDTSAWFVETDNLTELNVVDVKQGSPAQIKFDAVPGLKLDGRVERIGLRSQDKRGDVLYTVRVALNAPDPRLRWGMTAFVQFEKQ